MPTTVVFCQRCGAFQILGCQVEACLRCGGLTFSTYYPGDRDPHWRPTPTPREAYYDATVLHVLGIAED